MLNSYITNLYLSLTLISRIQKEKSTKDELIYITAAAASSNRMPLWEYAVSLPANHHEEFGLRELQGGKAL